MTQDIKYPRRRLIRSLLRLSVSGLVPLLSKPKITGLEKFPLKGPVIVVGNHTGAMEVVLMTIYAPRMIEYMGASDLPFKGFVALFVYPYGFIPVNRGNVSRASMKAAIKVLKQGGVIGIFPEGGLWEPNIRQAQTGVAWLSYHANAPILPIGFGTMLGAINDLFSFKRPTLKMNVGDLIPPIQIHPGKPRKIQFQEASEKIVDAIYDLVPKDEKTLDTFVYDESFDLQVEVYNDGNPIAIPEELTIKNGSALSKILHRTVLFNSLRDEVNLPIQPLKYLPDQPPIDKIITATTAILNYLDNDNPYYFTYRYKQKEGSAMDESIHELHRLAQWVRDSDYDLKIIPIRRYRKSKSSEFIVEDRPKETVLW
jgi:1-acyl-sn-glycerol-3-phosphate acyltransferase